jgi:hypothetical protein
MKRSGTASDPSAVLISGASSSVVPSLVTSMLSSAVLGRGSTPCLPR